MAIRKRYEEIDADPALLQRIREKTGVPDSVVEDPTRSILGIPEPESAEARAFNTAVAEKLGIQLPDVGENDDSDREMPSSSGQSA
jgi:hypothetical protein